MSDNYQAVYDAVRSRFGSVDGERAIAEVVREAFAYVGESIRTCAADVANEQMRPSVLFRPLLSLDGNAWCALLGDNIQEGCAAFGDSPEAAMRAFDVAWRAKVAKAVQP